eukprot:2118436-Lingulodinium_polyedra.AAC.1
MPRSPKADICVCVVSAFVECGSRCVRSVRTAFVGARTCFNDTLALRMPHMVCCVRRLFARSPDTKIYI